MGEFRTGIITHARFFIRYNAAVLDFRNPVFLRAGWTAGKIAPDARIIAFAGRSNAGKSSVLNALCGGRFARAAKTPGRTRMINLFQLRGGHLLADLPGYGYAKVSRPEQNVWRDKIPRFLRGPKIGGVVLVADARRGLLENDFALLSLAQNAPALVLLNKSDKLNRAEMRRCADNTRRALDAFSVNIAAQPFSALKKTGAKEARAAIAAFVCAPQTPQNDTAPAKTP